MGVSKDTPGTCDRLTQRPLEVPEEDKHPDELLNDKLRRTGEENINDVLGTLFWLIDAFCPGCERPQRYIVWIPDHAPTSFMHGDMKVCDQLTLCENGEPLVDVVESLLCVDGASGDGR